MIIHITCWAITFHFQKWCSLGIPLLFYGIHIFPIWHEMQIFLTCPKHVEMVFMFFQVLGENEDVINVTNYKIIEIFTKNIIHEMLKDGKCIYKAKMHHHIFKMFVACTKCRLPFITFSNTHQVVCTMQFDMVYTLAWLSWSNNPKTKGSKYQFLMVSQLNP